MRLMSFTVAALASVIASPAAAVEQIEIGARIPAKFMANDASGKMRNFASIRARKGAVLILVRSAKWCPYCQTQLKGLQTAGIAAALAQRGYSLNALSYDSPAVLAAFAARQGIGFTLLSDEKSVMIDALGLRDPAYAIGSFAYGVPKAAILVVDAKGALRAKNIAADYKFRPTPDAILALVDSVK